MATKGKRGFMRKAVDAMIAARTRQASAYSSGILLRMDQESLKTLGQMKTETRKRSSGYHPV